MDDHHDGAVDAGAAKNKIKLVALYGVRPVNLDLVRSENRAFAEMFELPISGEYMPQVRFVDPDLIIVYFSSLAVPADAAFARRTLAVLRGGPCKVIAIGDRDLLGDIDLNIDLIGLSFYDGDIGDEAIRTLIRRNVTFLAGFKRRIARIDSSLNRMVDLNHDIMAQHADMLNLYREESAESIRLAASSCATIPGYAAALIDVSLDIIKSLADVLDDEFMSIEYVQILMFLHRNNLGDHHTVLVSDLCGLIEAPYSTTVRRVDELAKKNYVHKSIDATDKRRINVEIAKRSTMLVEQFLNKLEALIGRLLSERSL